MIEFIFMVEFACHGTCMRTGRHVLSVSLTKDLTSHKLSIRWTCRQECLLEPHAALLTCVHAILAVVK